MPPGKRPPFIHAPVGAALGEEVKRVSILPGEVEALGNLLVPVRIVGAPAGVRIEQPAANRGERSVAGVAPSELEHAATPATIAQRLPLLGGEFVERLAQPERTGVGG